METHANKLHLETSNISKSNKGVIHLNARSSKKKFSDTFTPVPGFKANIKINEIDEISLADEKILNHKPPRSTKNKHNKEIDFNEYENFSPDHTLSSQMSNFVQNYDDLISLFQSKQPIKNQEQLEKHLQDRDNKKSGFAKKNSTKSHDKLVKSKYKLYY